MLFVIVSTVFNSYSQTDNPDLIERTTEKLSETADKPPDFSDLIDDVALIRYHPVNLNNTTPEEINLIPFLTERQSSNLLSYLKTYGKIYTVYELQAVEGFDSSVIQKILPYIAIGPEAEKHNLQLKNLFSYGRNQLVIRYEQVVQKQAGYHVNDSILNANPNAGYLGSPIKLFFRYTYTYYDRLSIGISGDKDAGEQFFRGNQKCGMDFYSGFISLRNTGILKQLTIGNFNLDFGQGLTLSSGISSGAIPGTGNLRRIAGGIRPSQSVNEGNYLRGVAAVLKKGKFGLSVFYSDHKRDANVLTTDTSTGNATTFSSFGSTGYHRLPRELEDKNTIRERVYGGNLAFRTSIFTIGFTGFSSHWSAELEPEAQPYNQFCFRGKENLNYGMDFQLLVWNSYLFGEISRSRNGGMALISGIQAHPDPRLAFAVSYRRYDRDYQDLMANATAQNASNANEEGIFVSFDAAVLAKLNLTGYADLFRFPWLKYRIDGPSHGSEYQLQADYPAGKTVSMYLRFRYREKAVNHPELQRPVNTLSTSGSLSLRYNLTWQVSPSTVLKSRFEWLRNSTDNAAPHCGYLLSQYFSWRLVTKHISVGFLYALFDTDTYDERIYAYESDVLYGYSVPSYNGEGLRCMILIDWSLFRWFEISARYGQTYYSDRNVIGTGLDQISGSMKSEGEVQIRLRF